MKRFKSLTILLSFLMVAIFVGPSFGGDNAICYNCPPMWADWATQLKTIKENVGITLPHDNKNSGQTL